MYQPYNVFGTTGQPRCTKIGCTKNYGTTRCTKNYCTPVVPRIMVQLDAIVMITPRLYQELWYRGCTKNYCMPVVPRIMVHNMYQKLRLARCICCICCMFHEPRRGPLDAAGTGAAICFMSLLLAHPPCGWRVASGVRLEPAISPLVLAGRCDAYLLPSA